MNAVHTEIIFTKYKNGEIDNVVFFSLFQNVLVVQNIYNQFSSSISQNFSQIDKHLHHFVPKYLVFNIVELKTTLEYFKIYKEARIY